MLALGLYDPSHADQTPGLLWVGGDCANAAFCAFRVGCTNETSNRRTAFPV